MENKYQHRIEEALDLLAGGQDDLTDCRLKYGQQWPKMRGQIKAGLVLREIGEQHTRFTATTFDSQAGWSNFLLQLEESPDAIFGSIFGPPESNFKPRLPENSLFLGKTGSIDGNTISKAARRPWQTWTVRVAASFVICVALLVALSVMVENSQPGDLWYGLKLNRDNTVTNVAALPQDKAETQFTFAGKRLEEVKQAVTEGRFEVAQTALLSYQTAIQQGINSTDFGGSITLQQQLQSQEQDLETLQQQKIPGPLQEQLKEVINQNQVQLNKLVTPTAPVIQATASATPVPATVTPTQAPVQTPAPTVKSTPPQTTGPQTEQNVPGEPPTKAATPTGQPSSEKGERSQVTRPTTAGSGDTRSFSPDNSKSEDSSDRQKDQASSALPEKVSLASGPVTSGNQQAESDRAGQPAQKSPVVPTGSPAQSKASTTSVAGRAAPAPGLKQGASKQSEPGISQHWTS